MASDDTTTTVKKVFGNKFVLGMIAGFVIGMTVKKLVVAIALLVVVGLAWYGASKRKKEEVEEEA